MKSNLYRSVIWLSSLLFIFILMSGNLYAQKGQQDVIYLKNGSIINGKITEIKVNESITIVNNCGDTWVINQVEIERVEKKIFPQSQQE
ncbi:MAG: hypothetical protein MZV63_28465 [Marinilabiliales bacterium]|nr:hypothetical protein [Marinilabiliales bacterium]